MFRLFLVLLFIMSPFDSFAIKVKLEGPGITDDEIANAIKNPRPLSVSKAIEYVKSQYKDDEIEALRFRNNNITSRGAYQILKFATTLPNLKKLSFHSNRIYDWRGQPGFEDFEKKLIALLNNPTYEKLDLRLNSIDNNSWYQDINAKTKNAYKIK